jgi:hypothetical protein
MKANDTASAEDLAEVDVTTAILSRWAQLSIKWKGSLVNGYL